MDKRILELAGVERKVLKEAYESWKPNNPELLDLIKKHNEVYNYLEINAGKIEYDDRRFKRAWNLAKDFYMSVKEIWQKFIPADAPVISLEMWGSQETIDPNEKATQVLRKSRESLERARDDMDIVDLDNAYSYAHGVIKIIKGLQQGV